MGKEAKWAGCGRGTEIRVKQWNRPWPGVDESSTVVPASDSEEQPYSSCRLWLGVAEGWGCASSLLSAWLVWRAQQPLVWRLGGCAAPHPRLARSRGQGEALPARGAGPPRCALDWSVPLAPGLSGDEITYGDRQAAAGRPPWTHPAVLVPGRARQRVGWLGVHGASASSQRWGLCPAAVPLPKPLGQRLDGDQGGLAARARSWRAEGGSGPGGWTVEQRAGAGGREGRLRQPCCSGEAPGKPVRLAQAARGGRFSYVWRVPVALHRTGTTSVLRGCCVPGLSERAWE